MAQNYEPPKWMVFLLNMIIAVGHWYHNLEPNPVPTSEVYTQDGSRWPTKLPSITKDFLLGTVTTKDLKHLESVTRYTLSFPSQKWGSINNTWGSMRLQPAELRGQPTVMGFEQPKLWLLPHKFGVPRTHRSASPKILLGGTHAEGSCGFGLKG